MSKLSVAIITYNEEKNIGRTIESLLDIADEIVIVDSFSTDKTEEIARGYQDRVNLSFIKNPFVGHIEQKNFALEQCQHEYILSVDADEVLSEKLKKSILKARESFEFNAYSFNRLTNYVDCWVKRCGWYPDTKLRLIKKGTACWTGVNPHDILVPIEGREHVVLLDGDLLHYSYDSISSHLTQTNKFTSIAAQAAYDKGQRSSLFKIVTRPLLKFPRDYIWKRGFLDGRYGFIICFINSLAAMLKYAKLYDIQRGKRP